MAQIRNNWQDLRLRLICLSSNEPNCNFQQPKFSQSLPHSHYEPALEALGGDFDEVEPAEFPQHILRFRNDQLLPLGLDPQTVTDDHFIAAFGKFQARRP